MAGYGRLGAGLIAAISCAIIFHFLEKKSGHYQEALIGCAFVLAASMGLLLVANSPQGGEEIKDILEGQILWTSWGHITFVTPIFIAVFLAWIIFKNKRAFLFYPLFAITIPFSFCGFFALASFSIFMIWGADAYPQGQEGLGPWVYYLADNLFRATMFDFAETFYLDISSIEHAKVFLLCFFVFSFRTIAGIGLLSLVIRTTRMVLGLSLIHI